MRLQQDLDVLFGTLINMGAKEQETGPNYMKFMSGGNSYVLEWIGGNLLLWKANMLFREGCRLYPFDKKTKWMAEKSARRYGST